MARAQIWTHLALATVPTIWPIATQLHHGRFVIGRQGRGRALPRRQKERPSAAVVLPCAAVLPAPFRPSVEEISKAVKLPV